MTDSRCLKKCGKWGLKVATTKRKNETEERGKTWKNDHSKRHLFSVHHQTLKHTDSRAFVADPSRSTLVGVGIIVTQRDVD